MKSKKTTALAISQTARRRPIGILLAALGFDNIFIKGANSLMSGTEIYNLVSTVVFFWHKFRFNNIYLSEDGNLFGPPFILGHS